jgi:hypothetical protein
VLLEPPPVPELPPPVPPSLVTGGFVPQTQLEHSKRATQVRIESPSNADDSHRQSVSKHHLWDRHGSQVSATAVAVRGVQLVSAKERMV